MRFGLIESKNFIVIYMLVVNIKFVCGSIQWNSKFRGFFLLTITKSMIQYGKKCSVYMQQQHTYYERRKFWGPRAKSITGHKGVICQSVQIG